MHRQDRIATKKRMFSRTFTRTNRIYTGMPVVTVTNSMSAAVQEWILMQMFHKYSWICCVYASQNCCQTCLKKSIFSNLEWPSCKKKLCFFGHCPKWQVTSSTNESMLSFTFLDLHRQKDSMYACKTFLAWSILARHFSKVWEYRKKKR